ncbi:ATP-binding protein [Candidatus Parvarchaeota archaeon]|uniref:ATP-binding protein n=1 Tax=Candidatus Acidifodinimicrobium mancum TaxID=2898728 RepID=A0A8T3UVE3_9ARCH|nr:ATP-binding protein [Candidatus Acidifodinimicrobium mancum]MBE5728962.1 ATP-binding protein [Candidatus Acidifodinimicrobium mancum]MBE5729939.1 ATP-binding protein [Candidatus Acidifodinimicrobium mancum]
MLSIYDLKKSIEQIVSDRPTQSKLLKTAISKNLKLDDLLRTEVKISNSLIPIAITDNYQVKNEEDFHAIVFKLFRSLDYIKAQMSESFGDVNIELKYENDDILNLTFIDGKSQSLLGFDSSLRYNYVKQSTFVYKGLLREPSLIEEVYKIINKEVSLSFVEDNINKLMKESKEEAKKEKLHANSRAVDSEKRTNKSIEEILAELGMEVYKGKVSLSDIGGYREIKERVKREIFVPFLYNKLLNKVKSANRIYADTNVDSALFYGPPGTGKTMMAKAIAKDEKVNFIYLNLSKVYSVWYSESPKRMEAAIDTAARYSNKYGKTVLFIDEIDSLGDREFLYDSESGKVLNTLLTRLSGMNSDKNRNLLIIGCTNLLDNLDPALVSRFKTKIYFDIPSKEDRVDILSKYATKLSREELEMLSGRTTNFSGRDIESMASIAEDNFAYDLANKKGSKGDDYKIGVDYYIKAIELMKRTKETNDKGRDMFG